MKTILQFSITIYIVLISAFTLNAQQLSYKIDTLHSHLNDERPHIALSFDDGSTKDKHTYKGSEWNSMIRKQLKDNHIHAVWFVAGKSVDSDQGKLILQNGIRTVILLQITHTIITTITIH